MSKRLYVTDLDGTLLDSSGELTEYSIGALNYLYKQGVDITFATARSYQSLVHILRAINNRLPVITFNGGHISDVITTNHLITNCINEKTAKSLYDCIEDYGVLISCYQNKEDILKSNEVDAPGMKQYIKDRENLLNTKVTYFDGFSKNEIMGYTIIDEKNKLMALKDKLTEDFEDINIEMWEDMYYKPWYWLSIHSNLATKGQMLKSLQEMVDKTFNEIIVFGDQVNDMDMFKHSDFSYAVENAVDELKELADGIIGPHDEDSVVKKILEMEGLTYATI